MNHYYPFGLNISALSSTAPLSKPNNYKFNMGSELIDDFDLGWYETPYRGYDAQLGRFMQIDPLADLFPDWTPYQFAYNDPIFWSDPMGLANQGGDSTWVSASQLVQYLWDNSPGNSSTYFEIVGYNPYGDEIGRTYTENGVNIYQEGEFAVRKRSSFQSSSQDSQNRDDDFDWLEYGKTATGTFGAVYGAAQTYFTPEGLWRGANGKYYSTNWGGNGYTGGRNVVVKTGKFFKVAGRWLGAANLVLDGVSYSQGDISTGEFMSNSFFTGIGIFGGVPGFLASTSYFIAANTYGDEQAARFQRSIMEKRANGTLSNPRLVGGGARKKSRNPKF